MKKLFSPYIYSGVAHTAEHAERIAEVTDQVVRQDGIVLYGRYENGHFVDLSSYQKAGDTVCFVGLVWKYLKRITPQG